MADDDKCLKKIQKKLREIEEIKDKHRRGETLEKTQLEKVWREAELRAALRTPAREAATGASSSTAASTEASTEASAEALCAAAKVGNEREVRRLLAAGVAPSSCHAGWSPLSLAADCNQLAAARLLVEAGADLAQADGKFGLTALHCAAFQGHADFVEFLVSQVADAGPWHTSAGATRSLGIHGVWQACKERPG